MSNILFCITGPSGSGKTSIMREVMSNELISFTTRQKREGEVEGKDYNFIEYRKYIEMVGNNGLVENTCYDGNYYGLSVDELCNKTNKGHAFFICDNHGFNQIKEKYDNVVSIFLYASFADSFQNMQTRGDSIEKIGKRLSTYHQELENKGQYDYVIKNNTGLKELTKDVLMTIVRTEILKQLGSEQ
jgi:guanylate kinase